MSEGKSCIILCRKATKMSQKQIKEDVSKHQSRACSTTLESFRGNSPEIVNGKSLLCFPSVFRKPGFTIACILSSSSTEREKSPVSGSLHALLRERQAVRARQRRVAEGQLGHSFSV